MATMRKKHKWLCRIADPEGGSNKEVEIEAYWDPLKIDVSAVAVCAAAEQTIQFKKKFVPVSAVLVEA